MATDGGDLPAEILRKIAANLVDQATPSNRVLYLLAFCGVCARWRSVGREICQPVAFDGSTDTAAGLKATPQQFRRAAPAHKLHAPLGAAGLLTGEVGAGRDATPPAWHQDTTGGACDAPARHPHAPPAAQSSACDCARLRTAASLRTHTHNARASAPPAHTTHTHTHTHTKQATQMPRCVVSPSQASCCSAWRRQTRATSRACGCWARTA
jgi:hypothetical protein